MNKLRKDKQQLCKKKGISKVRDPNIKLRQALKKIMKKDHLSLQRRLIAVRTDRIKFAARLHRVEKRYLKL